MSGASAEGDSNAEVLNRINEGKVVEITFDENNNSLAANKVRFYEGYVPGETAPKDYLGENMDVNQLLVGSERGVLKKWIKEHYVLNKPLKFRVILGETSLGWNTDFEHSFIAHAGINDGVIYLGSAFLSYLMRVENTSLREEVLDKDEYMHCLGMGHGSSAEYDERRALVERALSPLERIKQAFLDEDVYRIKDELETRLRASKLDIPNILSFLSLANDVALSQFTAPVEARYAIKKAVSIMDEADQQKLKSVLSSSAAKQYRDLRVVSELLIMMGDYTRLRDFIRIHAPELRGRSIWQVTPEGYFAAGGLGRVMQYYNASIAKLCKTYDIEFGIIEPHYQKRKNREKDSNKKYVDLRYDEDLTHNLRDIKNIAEFQVDVGDKRITAVVKEATNEFGVRIFTIRDKEGFYTHSLYNYRDNAFERDPEIPTWDEFSSFFSKASVELMKWKDAQKKHKKVTPYKAPVVWWNDSQTALVPVEMRKGADAEKRKKEENPEYKSNTFYKDAIVCGTTHTYKNRRDIYSLENKEGKLHAESAMRFLGIPEEYWDYFKREKIIDEGTAREKPIMVYDLASGGLRLSDAQFAVSKIHRDEVAPYDAAGMGSENMNLIGIANRDHIAQTAKYWWRALRELYGEKVDVWRPTTEQIRAGKKLSKKKLRLKPRQIYHTSFDVPPSGQLLDEDKPVISYSGREVDEKAGMKRALTLENIKYYVKNGAQVIIYGNIQNYPESQTLGFQLANLAAEIKAWSDEDYNIKGRFIFVPNFDLDQQRQMQAATDVQINDSDRKTGAGERTETNPNAVAAILVTIFDEGLLARLGLTLDLNVPGVGETLRPEMPALDPIYQSEEFNKKAERAYRRAIAKVLGFDSDDPSNWSESLSFYHDTSARIAPVSDAMFTSMEYLWQFGSAIRKKEAKIKAREMEKDLNEKEIMEKGLMEQLYKIDEETHPEKYLIYKITDLVLKGKSEESLLKFFTTVHFQKLGKNMNIPVTFLNNLIDAYSKDKSKRAYIKSFMLNFLKKTKKLSENKPDSVQSARDIQIMTGHALTVLSWIERDVRGAMEIRLTADDERMVQNEMRGRSFIDIKSLPDGIIHVETEGAVGFHNRGWEGWKKVRSVIHNIFVSDKKLMNAAQEKLVMYLMLHGFIEVPHILRKATQKDDPDISTIHETCFIEDQFAGSSQTTSTGVGHFQGHKLDIKHVTEGEGVQVNVLYDQNGEIVEVLTQRIKPGDWCLALPGYVDYMINLGGLRFNDLSVRLNDDDMYKFSPKLFDVIGVQPNAKEVSSRLKALGTAVKERVVSAPYIAIKQKGGAVIVKTDDKTEAASSYETKALKMNEIKFVESMPNTLLNMYRNFLTPENLYAKVVNEFAVEHKNAIERSTLLNAKSAKEAKIGEEIPDKAASLGKIEDLISYVDDNALFMQSITDPEREDPKLIRIAVEQIEAIGVDTVCGFLNEMQAPDTNVYLQLFSAQNKVANINYEEYKIAHKKLPQGFKNDKCNTVTLVPIFKKDEFATGGNKSGGNPQWQIGDIDPIRSILYPAGLNYDKMGLIRSISEGVRLSEISRNADYDVGHEFVSFTWAQIKNIVLTLGGDIRDFDLTKEDLITLARSEDISEIVTVLNKLAKLLPILPINVEELKQVYARAKEAWIRA